MEIRFEKGRVVKVEKTAELQKIRLDYKEAGAQNRLTLYYGQGQSLQRNFLCQTPQELYLIEETFTRLLKEGKLTDFEYYKSGQKVWPRG